MYIFICLNVKICKIQEANAIKCKFRAKYVLVGKFCRDAKPRGYEGCKNICIHIVPATYFTLNSYPIAIFTYTLSFISTVCNCY